LKGKGRDIRRQVFLKVASRQLSNTTPKEVVGYAKQLEEEFQKWN